MAADGVLLRVLAVARASMEAGLLANVDCLSEGLEADGWIKEVAGGEWSCPGEPAWSLLSSDHAPNVAIFFSHEDAAGVLAAVDELVRLFDQYFEGARSSGCRPAEGLALGGENGTNRGESESEVGWLEWGNKSAQISLIARPAHCLGSVSTRAHLHVQIDRVDTPSEGLPLDDDRARCVARSGSPAARWHLAGESVLPADVEDELRRDANPAVAAAMDVRKRRHD